MKIMQVMPDFGLAGAEIMCENLTCELANLGNDVFVVSLYDFHSAITERLEKAGIRIYYLNKKKGFDQTIYKKLYTIIKNESPDVIHTHRYVTKYTVPIARMCGIKKQVHTIHSVAQNENTKMGVTLNRFFFRYAGLIPVALSKRIQETVVETYALDPSMVPIVFNGVDLKKCQIKNDYSIKDTINILHIGRFEPVKNHVLLLKSVQRVVQKHPNVKLQLIGDGPTLTEVKEIAKSIGIENNIQFLGLQSNVYPFLSNADIFVLPSLYEGMPMTLIEAMGTGLPIIATRVGGIPDMLEDGGSGILVNCNEAEFERSIDRLIEDGSLRTKLGTSARSVSERFSALSMAKNYEVVYRFGGVR